MIDTSPLSLMYYLLYNVTFIFGRILVNEEWKEDNVLTNVISNFTRVISRDSFFSKSNFLRYFKEFVKNGGKPEEAEEILDQFTYDFATLYIPKFNGNIICK